MYHLAKPKSNKANSLNLYPKTKDLGRRFAASGLGSCPFQGGASVVVDSLFIDAPIVSGSFVFVSCYVLQYCVL